MENSKYDYKYVLALSLIPVFGIFGTIWYIWNYGIVWQEPVLLVMFWIITGLGITVGYHRLFTHRSFKAHPIVDWIMAIIGAAALENSALKWCSDHRRHHKHLDTTKDPYSITKGFFHAHIGWILENKPSPIEKVVATISYSMVEKSNILQYLGVHYIDVIRFVTLAVPVRVMAIGQKNWLKSQGLDVHDSIQCMVEWESISGHRFIQTLLVNWIDPETTSAMSDQKIKFIGTNGRYESDQKERGVRILLDGQPMEEPNPDFCRNYKSDDGKTIWEGYGIDSINCFLNDVHSIINREKIPQNFEGKRPTFSESLFSTSVIEAASKSLEEYSVWKSI